MNKTFLRHITVVINWVNQLPLTIAQYSPSKQLRRLVQVQHRDNLQSRIDNNIYG